MADLHETSNWNTNEVKRAQKAQPTGERKSSAPRPPRRPRKRKKKSIFGHIFGWILYVVLVIAASAGLAGIGWLLACDLCAFNKPYETATVEVSAQDNVETVADKLKEAGLIEYPWFFRLFGWVADANEKIGIGTYELNTDMDYRALITGMYSSGGNMTAETVKLTIPEGLTVAQTLELMAEKDVNSLEKLVEAAKTSTFDYAFIDNDSQELTRLEGFLFPDTYEFYVGENPRSAINRLLKNFTTRISEFGEDIDASAYSLAELVTIASLIEKETDGSDHATIASVIYNRLSDTGAGGTYKLLQIDAALYYALPEHTGALTNESKEVDSPYNLYKNAGLPPTPIANPGLASIKAALNPEDTNYYYYALGKSGKHSFFTNYGDHVNFINSGEYGG